MVLESIIGAKKAERKPFKMLFIGMFFASIAILLSLWIFKQQSSLIMVFLTVLACVPLMYKTIKLEAYKDTKIKKESLLLKEHGKALKYFMFLFLGFVIAFSVWYVFLPVDTVQILFSTQTETIRSINSQVSGAAINPAYFTSIIANNFKVLLFVILFSFFYGAGAIFILTWNASVIAGAAGNFIRNNLSEYAYSVGFAKAAGYFHIFSLGIMRYLTHGVFEILAYFIGGLAGGIISVAVIHHNIESPEFKHTLYDSIDLIILAVIILIIAGFIETFITPAIF